MNIDWKEIDTEKRKKIKVSIYETNYKSNIRDIVLVKFDGELVSSDVESIFNEDQDTIFSRNVWGRLGIKKIIFDLRDLAYADSSGAARVAITLRIFRDQNATAIAILNQDSDIVKILEAIGFFKLDNIIYNWISPEDALERIYSDS
jgi:hypothetical protein